MVLGVNSLPALPRDSSDRNRTSAFAFTGNKFEFRAVGASQTCARPMLILNTIVADSFNWIADRLEAELKSHPRDQAIQNVVAKTLKQYKGAIFNGNNYSEEWRKEAAARGLFNLPSSPEAFAVLNSDKNKKLFSSLGVLTEEEIISNQHVLYENYTKALNVEAQCLLNMAVTHILPATLEYKSKLFNTASGGGAHLKTFHQQYSDLVELLVQRSYKLKDTLYKAKTFTEEQLHEKATFFYQEILNGEMKELRHICDELEKRTDNKVWPLPQYSEMLYFK